VVSVYPALLWYCWLHDRKGFVASALIISEGSISRWLIEENQGSTGSPTTFIYQNAATNSSVM